VAGSLSSEQLETLVRTARDHGQGEVCTTARLNLEIPGVSRTDVSDAAAELSEAGLVLGSTGPSVRSVVACKGTICRHGCCDTFGLTRQLEETEGGRPLPRKLKIAIAGCPNNCSRVQFNDIGFMGHRYPRFDEGECTQCGACETVCKEDAIAVGDDGLVFTAECCVGCGDCIAACVRRMQSVWQRNGSPSFSVVVPGGKSVSAQKCRATLHKQMCRQSPTVSSPGSRRMPLTVNGLVR